MGMASGFEGYFKSQIKNWTKLNNRFVKNIISSILIKVFTQKF